MMGLCLCYLITSKEFHISICLFAVAGLYYPHHEHLWLLRREGGPWEEQQHSRIVISFPSGAAGSGTVGRGVWIWILIRHKGK